MNSERVPISYSLETLRLTTPRSFLRDNLSRTRRLLARLPCPAAAFPPLLPLPLPTSWILTVPTFDHEKLDVYKVAVELVAVAKDVVEHLPRGRAYLADQLQLAAISIPLNTAEGAGEFSKKDKRRFYRMALRSATEAAAILDVCLRLKLGDEAGIARGRGLLYRIVAMLTRIAKAQEESGAGAGAGTGTE